MKIDLDYNINNMATIKSFTSLEQSKKLAEFLPLESADMCYPRELYWGEIKLPVMIADGFQVDWTKSLPCWSVGALIQLLPDTIEDDYKLFIDKTSVSYIRHDTEIGCTYNHKCYLEENLIDAICKMICWLLEQKLIKTE